MRFLEYDRYGEATAQQEAAGSVQENRCDSQKSIIHTDQGIIDMCSQGHERSQGDAGDVRGFGLLHLHIGRTGLHRHRIGQLARNMLLWQLWGEIT